ncbi:MAG: RecX family transcriptional regulator [Bacteriovoracaceae bacterium]|nr:RecX family transcriptional regulator [Bacteriovoracaceae bacterium]
MDKETKKAYSYLIRLISKRDYSRYKLEQKLRERGHSHQAIDESIAEIISLNYLREDNYIEARIKGFMHKNCSMSYIRSKLAEEYLDIEISLIDSIFIEHGISETDQITRIIYKKLPSSPRADLDYDSRIKIENRVLRYLYGKGHQIVPSRIILKSIFC